MRQAIAFLAGAICMYAEVPGVVAIRNARIVTAAGAPVARGTVVIRGGLIEAVGAEVAAPADAWVIEAPNLTVYPGLIDSLSTWGIPGAAPAAGTGGGRGGGPLAPGPQAAQGPPAQGPEDRPMTTSWLQAQDILRAGDATIAAARDAGFTTAVMYPTSGLIAGQGAAVNLGGDKAGSMVVAAPTGQYLSVNTRQNAGYPGSLMGVFAYLRQIFLDADHYKLEKDAYAAAPRGKRRPDYDRALEGLLQSPRILMPATRLVEMDRMLRFAAEWKRSAVLYGGHEAYRAADLLKKSGAPLLVNLQWPERDRNADPDTQESLRTLELREKAPSGPGVLAKAGVKFAFYSGTAERPADLRGAVKRAIDAGLSSEDAVRALTIHAAEIYGLADRMGSVEKGKIANLVVADGDLFATSTRIRYVFVDGVKYEPSAEGSREETR